MYQYRSIAEEEVRKRRGYSETRGDVLIRGIWESHNESIIDIRLGDSDYDTYKKEPEKPLLVL